MYGGTVRELTPSRSPSGLSPRVRGNPQIYAEMDRPYGLSPRVRGNRTTHLQVTVYPRVTGEPSGPYGPPFVVVYPRVYGGTREMLLPALSSKGLSPRVRGNRNNISDLKFICQVYPRVYGGTEGFNFSPNWPAVYPRVYGGTRGVQGSIPACTVTIRDGSSNRSIPACTGEPHQGCDTAADLAVYPRVYGGTAADSERAQYEGSHGGTLRRPGPFVEGLSPRVRGNPVGSRFIPLRVYSRVYGGTLRGMAVVQEGLSPRVRGNQVQFFGHGKDLNGVYPRVYGGTHAPSTRSNGVYPRVYGGTYPSARTDKVYPRVYGGTSLTWSGVSGLSPRVRGNRIADDGVGTTQRSIPACTAGPHRRRSPPHRGLSPRVRGNR